MILCDLDPWGSESCRSIPVFFTVPKRCTPPIFVVFKYTQNQGHTPNWAGHRW